MHYVVLGQQVQRLRHFYDQMLQIEGVLAHPLVERLVLDDILIA